MQNGSQRAAERRRRDHEPAAPAHDDEIGVGRGGDVERDVGDLSVPHDRGGATAAEPGFGQVGEPVRRGVADLLLDDALRPRSSELSACDIDAT